MDVKPKIALKRITLFLIALPLLGALLYLIVSTLDYFLVRQSALPSFQSQTLYPVFVSSGGIHAEFVFDRLNSPYEWSALITPADVGLVDQGIRYMSVGQGAKRFFYQFLDWDDLTVELALHTVFIPNATAIHVEFREDLNPNLAHFKLMISREAYLKLADFIVRSFKIEANSIQKIDQFNYTGRDGFFWGDGEYHLFNTCNMWTARGLRQAGLPGPYWGPFRYSIEHSLADFKL